MEKRKRIKKKLKNWKWMEKKKRTLRINVKVWVSMKEKKYAILQDKWKKENIKEA